MLRRALRRGTQLAAKFVDSFQDQESGGFYFTTADHEGLLIRSKSLGVGGILPDANGVAVDVLLDLAKLRGRPDGAAAKRTLGALTGLVQQSPHSTEHLLLTAAKFLHPPGSSSRPALTTPAKTEAAAKPDADAKKRASPVMISGYVSRVSVKPGDTVSVCGRPSAQNHP